MPSYTVTLRKTEPECNPEYTTVTVEADSEDALRELVKGYEAELALPVRERTFRPGWNSRAEPEHWGKPLGLEVLSVDGGEERVAYFSDEEMTQPIDTPPSGTQVRAEMPDGTLQEGTVGADGQVTINEEPPPAPRRRR